MEYPVTIPSDCEKIRDEDEKGEFALFLMTCQTQPTVTSDISNDPKNPSNSCSSFPVSDVVNVYFFANPP